MICVTIEIREGPLTRRVQITAPSIELAMKVAGDRKPGHRVRLLFPMNRKPSSFLTRALNRGRRLEMGPSTRRADEAVPVPRDVREALHQQAAKRHPATGRQPKKETAMKEALAVEISRPKEP
jgi:hypothetical protein